MHKLEQKQHVVVLSVVGHVHHNVMIVPKKEIQCLKREELHKSWCGGCLIKSNIYLLLVTSMVARWACDLPP